jgi:hypothetical protein
MRHGHASIGLKLPIGKMTRRDNIQEVRQRRSAATE